MGMIFLTFVSQPGFRGVVFILRASTPLQVRGSIVFLIAVDVVDLGMLVRVWDK
jgi:hypothetical protein